jgi:hypothetical protein
MEKNTANGVKIRGISEVEIRRIDFHHIGT